MPDFVGTSSIFFSKRYAGKKKNHFWFKMSRCIYLLKLNEQKKLPYIQKCQNLKFYTNRNKFGICSFEKHKTPQ